MKGIERYAHRQLHGQRQDVNCIYDTGTGGNLKSQRIRKPLKKQSEQKGQKRLEEYSQQNRT